MNSLMEHLSTQQLKERMLNRVREELNEYALVFKHKLSSSIISITEIEVLTLDYSKKVVFFQWLSEQHNLESYEYVYEYYYLKLVQYSSNILANFFSFCSFYSIDFFSGFTI